MPAPRQCQQLIGKPPESQAREIRLVECQQVLDSGGEIGERIVGEVKELKP